MRYGMAMIELIFAIVIIAISVMTIPSMMNVASEASKKMIIDDDAMARLSAQMMDKFQARWGGEYVLDVNGSLPTYISSLTSTSDLNCSRPSGTGRGYRINPDSLVECNLTQIPLAIPTTVGTGATQADGNVSKGIEKLNGGTETLSIVSSSGETYTINATYNVRYVNDSVTPSNHTSNTVSTTWRLGSSATIGLDNGGSVGTNVLNRTHMKRVVVRFWDPNLNVDTTLTFYKSNIGSD